MTSRTLAPLIDSEQNDRWMKAAIEAAELHDGLMDVLKIFEHLDPSVSQHCRTVVGSEPLKGMFRLKELLEEDPELHAPTVIKKLAENHAANRRLYMTVDEHDRLRDAFLAFYDNPDLRIESTEQYSGTQLKVVATRNLDRRTSLTGLTYVLFRLPAEDEQQPGRDGDVINEDCTTHTARAGQQTLTRYAQLGPAALLNHHCDRRKQNALETGKTPAQGLGAFGRVYQPTLSRNVVAGEELLIDYGADFFDNNECLCSATDLHVPKADPRPRTRSSPRHLRSSLGSNSGPTPKVMSNKVKQTRSAAKRVSAINPAGSGHLTRSQSPLEATTPPLIEDKGCAGPGPQSAAKCLDSPVAAASLFVTAPFAITEDARAPNSQTAPIGTACDGPELINGSPEKTPMALDPPGIQPAVEALQSPVSTASTVELQDPGLGVDQQIRAAAEDIFLYGEDFDTGLNEAASKEALALAAALKREWSASR